jgi:hypothetical protein
MPLRWRDEDTRFVATGAVFFDADDGPWAIAAPCEGLPLGTQDHPSNFDVDWSDRAAIYLCLAWLADRGHACLWMIPTTHGGRIEAWDGLTAWEVSAILVARSVGRVARGLGPVRTLLRVWVDTNDTLWRSYRRRVNFRGACDFGCIIYSDGYSIGGPKLGPETGDAGKLAADRAALTDGCALLCDGGVCCPEL